MGDENLRSQLLARRAELAGQIAAIDTVLAALPPAPETAPDPRPSLEIPLTPAPDSPAVAAAALSPPSHPAPPPSRAPESAAPPADPFDEPMGAQPDGQHRPVRWGRVAARVEGVLAAAPEEFSFHTILELFKSRFHWTGYPSEGSIASSYSRAVQKHGYRVLHAGSGRRPTVYTKQKAPPTPAPALPSLAPGATRANPAVPPSAAPSTTPAPR